MEEDASTRLLCVLTGLISAAFTHAVTSAYGASILFLLLRIGKRSYFPPLRSLSEVNIICRYNYLDLVNQRETMDSDVQGQYLLSTNYAIQEGLALLAKQVENATKEVH